MKTASKILSIALIGCSLMSCQTRRSNIELTDFTRGFISLYINHPDNFFAKNRRNEILIMSSTDTLYYSLSIHFQDLRSRSSYYCEELFVGQTFYLGYRIRVFGDENPIFYSVKDKIRKRRHRKDDPFYLIRPNVWSVSLHKEDMSLCKTRTFKTKNYRDISAILNWAERHFKVADTIEDRCAICGAVSHL
ncbi:MAG: hypothetical protein FWC94_05230 [Bacteroidales bacterium]|nr:hypothetical protein [Bacteroidales bacterium]